MSDKPHHPLAGATGRFPKGKQNANDEGELRVAARADHDAKLVILDFGKPVSWLSVGPDGARQIALTLLRLAGNLDGQITTVKTQ